MKTIVKLERHTDEELHILLFNKHPRFKLWIVTRTYICRLLKSKELMVWRKK